MVGPWLTNAQINSAVTRLLLNFIRTDARLLGFAALPFTALRRLDRDALISVWETLSEQSRLNIEAIGIQVLYHLVMG